MLWLNDVLVNGVTYSWFKIISENRIVVIPARDTTSYSAN